MIGKRAAEREARLRREGRLGISSAASEAEIESRVLAEGSLSAFIAQAWPIVEPSAAFIPGWHIDAMAQHLEAVSSGEINQLLINIPPGHMKSLTVSVFWFCWEWIRRPEGRWLFVSNGQPLATRDSLKCRTIIESDWYTRNWGRTVRLRDDQNQKTRFNNTATGYRISFGLSGKITGERGDRIVVDDPHDAKDVMSDASRINDLDRWQHVWSTRLNTTVPNAAKVVIMQRLHESDIAGHILANELGWEHLCLPAEYDRPPQVPITGLGFRDPRTEPGELLWPEGRSQDDIQKLKANLGSYGAAGQLQQRPSPAEGGRLKRFWWRYWCLPGQDLPPVSVQLSDGGTASIKAVPLPIKFDETIQSWDATFKDTKASDYVVGQIWARKGSDKFALDQVRNRMDFPATIAAVRGLSASWPAAQLKLIEDKANGPAVIATLKHEIAGIVPFNPQGSKDARAAAVSPDIEAGNVYLPHPSIAPWVEGFVEECAAFPNSVHDDQVDAMTQALIRLGPGQTLSALDRLKALGG